MGLGEFGLTVCFSLVKRLQCCTLVAPYYKEDLPEKQHEALKEGSEIVMPLNGLLWVKSDITEHLRRGGRGESQEHKQAHEQEMYREYRARNLGKGGRKSI